MAGESQSEGIDQGSEQLGALYAKALLGAAEASGQVDRILEELESLVDDVLAKIPQFDAILASRRLDPEAKIAMIDRAFKEKMSPTLLNFLKVVARHERLDSLRAIRHAARKLFNAMRGRIEVTMRTASPLSNPLRKTIADRLSEKLGKAVDLKSVVQPDLLGGIVVQIGDTLFDGSVANRLERTKQSALDATMRSIRQSFDRFATA